MPKSSSSILCSDISCSGLQILEDFCSYLCLIVRDGLNYTFIHRSIFEYYVALFFSKLNNENAKKAIPRISQYNILIFLKNLNNYYFNLYHLKPELEFFIEKFNNKNTIYNTKQNIPINFIKLFIFNKLVSLNSKLFFEIKDHTYLFAQYIDPILTHISEEYKSGESGYKIVTIDESMLIDRENINFYNRLNNDIEYKKLFQRAFTDYQEILLEISSKENEINQEDFADL